MLWSLRFDSYPPAYKRDFHPLDWGVSSSKTLFQVRFQHWRDTMTRVDMNGTSSTSDASEKRSYHVAINAKRALHLTDKKKSLRVASSGCETSFGKTHFSWRTGIRTDLAWSTTTTSNTDPVKLHVNVRNIWRKKKQLRFKQRRICIFGALGCFKLGTLLEGSRRLISYKLALHVLAIFSEQAVPFHKHNTVLSSEFRGCQEQKQSHWN